MCRYHTTFHNISIVNFNSFTRHNNNNILFRLIKDGDFPELPKPANIKDHLANAMEFYKNLQTADGHWSGDYSGPLFLMAGIDIVMKYTTFII